MWLFDKAPRGPIAFEVIVVVLAVAVMLVVMWI